MTSYFDYLNRQVEDLERVLGPLREQHERIMRSVAPILEQGEVLRNLGASVAALGSRDELLNSLRAISRPSLLDFRAFQAFASPISRDLRRTIEALTAQTRWINETARIGTRSSWETDEALFASIEKLVGSQNALLSQAVWSAPRSFGAALTDILYAGRSAWATSYSGTAGSRVPERTVVEVAAESEAIVSSLARADPGREQLVSAEEAKEEVAAVSQLLSERAAERTQLIPAPSPTLEIDGVLLESIGLLVTLAEVMRLVETRARKPVAGGYSSWALGRALNLIDAGRSPEDRFSGLVRFLFDFFVDGVNRADQSLQDARPRFFSVVIQDLRHTDAAHEPEVANKVVRIAPSLELREKRIREIAGKVPVTREEWTQALIELLQKACEAAKEFRDRLL